MILESFSVLAFSTLLAGAANIALKRVGKILPAKYSAAESLGRYSLVAALFFSTTRAIVGFDDFNKILAVLIVPPIWYVLGFLLGLVYSLVFPRIKSSASTGSADDLLVGTSTGTGTKNVMHLHEVEHVPAAYFGVALKEYETIGAFEDLKAKFFCVAEGDASKAKALYIKHRASALYKEHETSAPASSGVNSESAERTQVGARPDTALHGISVDLGGQIHSYSSQSDADNAVRVYERAGVIAVRGKI
jgi:hypothetical protein